MGTYRQPGIYVHKGYEQFNKAMAEGNKNFLSTYAAAQKQKTANKKANEKLLRDAKKGYDKWGDVVLDARKFASDAGVAFDKDLEKKIDDWGQEYYELLGNTSKEAQDRLTQLRGYPDQVARMLASGQEIKKEYGASFNIPNGKGSVDQARTSKDHLAFAANIFHDGGSYITPYEEVDANGKPTGNILAHYNKPAVINNGIVEEEANEFYLDTDALYAQLTDEKSPFRFIYTKGDLKEVLNPMMDLAKGESKIVKDNNGKAKTVKGDTWYSNNAKETEVISYEPVDPNDPNYDPTRPYKEIITVTTGYQNDQNMGALKHSLETVNLNSLMATGEASWMFDDVISWARERYAADPAFSEGGLDDRVDTADDNLFTVDDNGDLVQIPWISDPTSPTSAYAGTSSDYKKVSEVQHAIFNKYAKEWMMDPENGLIPEDVSRIKREKYITEKDYNKKSVGRSGGRGFTPTVSKVITYGNAPKSKYKNARYPGKDLTPYQYDVLKAEDIVFKPIAGKTGKDAIDLNTQKPIKEVVDGLVKQLNSLDMGGVKAYDQSKNQRLNYPKFFTVQEGIDIIKKGIASGKTDKTEGEAKIKEYENAPANQYLIYEFEGPKKKQLVPVFINDSSKDAVYSDVLELLHTYNGLISATQAYDNKFKKL